MRRHRRRQRGQILILAVLLLPVLLAFVGLSISASLELNNKSRLDQSVLTAGIAASSDACMSSPYGFALYECTSGNPPPTSPYMPLAPPFTIPTTPRGDPLNTTCPDSSGPKCIALAHDAALMSAQGVAELVLKQDYPGYAITLCSSWPCAPLSSGNIDYWVDVSYWYYYDADDVPTAGNGTPSDDVTSMGGPNGGKLRTPERPGDSSTSLVCPGNVGGPNNLSSLGRKITVSVAAKFDQPFQGILGIGPLDITSTTTTYGCGG